MFRNRVFVTAVVLCVGCGVARAADENPLKKAKVGDWVSYKITKKMGGVTLESERKQTVIEKRDAEADVEVVDKANNLEERNVEVIKLGQKYEPWKKYGSWTQAPNTTVKELGSGAEKLTVGGKTYDTEWKEFESTTIAMGREMKTKTKVWIAKETPLGGMVKMTSDLAGKATDSTVVELTGSGSGK